MTSPFDWKNRPSKIGQELQRDATRAANARGQGPGKPPAPSLAPRQFYVYSKAGAR